MICFMKRWTTEQAVSSGCGSLRWGRTPLISIVNLDRLEFLQGIVLAPMVLDDIPAHRVARLRRQGERYFTDGLRDITSDRRLAILAVCVVEWAAAVADTGVETHDRIVGAIWRDAKKICDTRVAEAQVEIEATLAGFRDFGLDIVDGQR